MRPASHLDIVGEVRLFESPGVPNEWFSVLQRSPHALNAVRGKTVPSLGDCLASCNHFATHGVRSLRSHSHEPEVEYFGAPNPINSLHKHIGGLQVRVIIPHGGTVIGCEGQGVLDDVPQKVPALGCTHACNFGARGVQPNVSRSAAGVQAASLGAVGSAAASGEACRQLMSSDLESIRGHSGNGGCRWWRGVWQVLLSFDLCQSLQVAASISCEDGQDQIRSSSC
eukprot:6120169-Amphidinium_carterae.1